MAEIILFLIKCIYIMLPGVFANMAPVIFRNSFKSLAIPIDLGKTYKSKRLFGDNKTFRGFIFGIIFSIITAYIQTLLYNYPRFQSLSFINYHEQNFFIWGFLIGLGVLSGDLVESFIKRRLGIAPGKSFIPWDQIDSTMGAVVFIFIIYRLSFAQIITIVTLSFLFSTAISRIGHLLGLRKGKLI